ncbi:hypothetical protein E5329_09560 [Petralouisia muris]|uniref:Uncharacterized protein n=1 Tax=Petralouisia muris TaxID=3032872 RepID=A0AC61RX04_9FIRM|nr:MaoC/PaaZ C-terminal domain-containing protein [Petralouisia muris]TGY96439.1 hypothetical protein E5329_09560 [Petralouisia muris]
MKVNLAEELVGLSTEHRELTYNWRDISLYALSVGAKADDLMYTYEKNMKALPTYGVVPYWGAVNITPRIPHPLPAAQLADQIIHSTIAPLHMEHELIMHRPIDPMKGTLIFQDMITDVYDRGEGKGAVIKTKVDVHDEAGNLICTNVSSTLFQEGGGFGGTPMPKNKVKMPDGNPDFAEDDFISPVQNVLYRLTGDTNLVHVDPEFAKERGFDKVFMQGLCPFGFACRMAIGQLIPGEPERMTRMTAQMRSILYPDTPIRLLIWKIDEQKAYFRLINKDTGNAVLDKGVFEWK